LDFDGDPDLGLVPTATKPTEWRWNRKSPAPATGFGELNAGSTSLIPMTFALIH